MSDDFRRVGRRRVLAAMGAAGFGGLAGCASPEGGVDDPDHEFELTAAVETVEVGDTETERWLYDGSSPGPELRVTEGDSVRVVLRNELPEPTTIHHHGMTLYDANDADGVPGITQEPVEPGEEFAYEFEAYPSGTHWYHSHVGLQLDRGLYGPLIVEPDDPAVEYDREYTLLFEDFLADDPAVEFAGEGTPIAPSYDGFLINGRPPSDPESMDVTAGERVRLRLINAAAVTNFSVYLSEHPLTVTHTDGPAVEPHTVDSISLWMGERYDAVVEADTPGVWRLGAVPFAEADTPVTDSAEAELRYAEADPTAEATDSGPPGERRLEIGDLRSLELEAYESPEADRRLQFDLGLDGTQRAWTIGDEPYPDAETISLEEGDHTSVVVSNNTPMPHPIHLHGHHFRVGDVIKDTVAVPNDGQRALSFAADNPGEWLFHCHHLYHHASGMTRLFNYADADSDSETGSTTGPAELGGN
ncbi:MAG: multicopper oxidase family protein [Natronomonas sp.]